MTLPRFTSGQVGRLDFAALNEAFGYIDEARGVSPSGMRADRVPPRILATLGAYDATALGHSWSESVVTETGTIETLQGGRSSGPQSEPHQFPAITADGSEAASGDVVMLDECFRKNGKAVYLISPLVTSASEMLKVIGIFQTMIPGRMWSYRCRRVQFSFSVPGSPGFGWVESGSEVSALNGCENAVDQIPQSIGVGTQIPAAGSATRMPIKVGTVVLAKRRSGGFEFSIPNGYAYQCPP